MKRLVCVLMAICMVFALVACGNGGETSTSPTPPEQSSPNGASPVPANADPIVISACTTTYPLRTVALDEARAAIEERTGGAVTFNITAAGVMGADREVAEAVQLGSLDLTISADPMIGTAIGDLGWLALPGYLTTNEQVDELYLNMDGRISKFISSAMAENGIIRIAAGDAGFRSCQTGTKKVSSIADLKGLKVRVADSPENLSFYTNLGCLPIAMSGSEVLTALEQGTIDAVDNGTGSIVPMGVQDNITDIVMLNAVYGGCSVIINESVWNSIPAEYQEIITEEFQKAMEKYTVSFRADEAAILDEYTADGRWTIVIPDEEMRAAIADASAKVIEEFKDKYDSEVIDYLLSLIESQ